MTSPRVLVLTLAGIVCASGIGFAGQASGQATWDTTWSSGLEISSSDYVFFSRAATSAAGKTIVSGTFAGTASIPTGPAPDDSILVSSIPSGDDIVLGTLSADADYFELVTTIASTSVVFTDTSLAVSGGDTPAAEDDTIFITGRMSNGTTYFPTGPASDDSIAITGSATWTGFVGAISPGSEYFAWVTPVAASSFLIMERVTVRPSGDLILAGSFEGSATLPTGSGSISLSSPSAQGGFIAQLNPDGETFDWGQVVRVPSGWIASDFSVAVSADDTPYVVGKFNDSVSLPTGPLADDSVVLTATALGTYTGFAAAINADDSYFAWAQSMDTLGGLSPQWIGVTEAGQPVTIGQFSQSLTVPTGPNDDSITLMVTGANDVYVALMNSDDSYFSDALAVGSTNGDGVGDGAFGADGTLLLTGYYGGAMSFPAASGTISLTSSNGSTDAFVAGLDLSTFTFRWAETAGAAPNDYLVGAAVAPVADDGALFMGYLYGSMTLPGSQPPISFTSQNNGSGIIAGIRATPPSPDPGPTPATPSGPPLSLSGVAGDQSISLAWLPPASSGSFPVSTYQVQSTPSSAGCVVPAATLSCEISGLRNGVEYSFRVRALTGAGWGAWSSPVVVVPEPPAPEPSIVIAGFRDGRSVVVDGVTTGLVGAEVTPWFRFPGPSSYEAGTGMRTVSADGTFTWQRVTRKKIYVYFRTDDGVRSNRVIIPAG